MGMVARGSGGKIVALRVMPGRSRATVMEKGLRYLNRETLRLP
jgi:hypothetical protein